MICKKCGQQIPENNKFCWRCGASIEEKGVSAAVKTNSKKLSKGAVVGISAGGFAAICIIITITIIVFISTAPKRQMKKALASNSYSRVTTVLNKADGNKKLGMYKVVADFAEDAADKLNKDFTFDINSTKDVYDLEDAFENAMISFCRTNFGDLFLDSDGDQCGLKSLRNNNTSVSTALDKFYAMHDSKYAYYGGLIFMKSAASDEECYDDYFDAVEEFANVLPEDTNYKDALAKTEESFNAFTAAVMALSDKYIAEGDYNAAKNILDSVDGRLDSDDGAFQTKIKELKKSCAEKFAQRAEELFKAGDIYGAISNINVADSLDPENGYNAKVKEYELYLPLELYDKDNIFIDNRSSNNFDFAKLETANDKSEHKNSMSFNIWPSSSIEMADGYTYHLAGNYDKVSGTLFIPEDYKSDEQESFFEAYGDGKLIYTSDKISLGFLPKAFEFNVSGVQQLEIKVFGVHHSYFNSSFAISNFIAQKSIPNA